MISTYKPRNNYNTYSERNPAKTALSSHFFYIFFIQNTLSSGKLGETGTGHALHAPCQFFHAPGRSNQNIVLLFSAFSGISWMTSQCSTIFPSLTRKISTAACPRSDAFSVIWLWMNPSLPLKKEKRVLEAHR